MVLATKVWTRWRLWFGQSNDRNLALPLAQKAKTVVNTFWKSPRRVASLLLWSVVIAGCAGGPKSPSPALQQQIESATSRTEHVALAAFYDREAAGARTNAANHRRMAKSYEAMSPPERGGASMRAHCNAIVNIFDGIAVEYDGLAADHRRLGDQVRP